MNLLARSFALILWLSLAFILVACNSAPSAEADTADSCPLTEPVWLKPPEDSAVLTPPEFGYYFVNDDRSIWAGAWGAGADGYHLLAGDEGNKIGWFRPAGEKLTITGQRLDAQAPPLEALLLPNPVSGHRTLFSDRRLLGSDGRGERAFVCGLGGTLRFVAANHSIS